MSTLTKVTLPKIETFHVSFAEPDRVRFRGTLTMRDPGKELAGFFRGLHEAAMEDRLKVLHLDVRGLTFVNSSSIRLFVDWTTWLKPGPDGSRYLLQFHASRQVTWQKTCFSALQSLAGSVIGVDYEDRD
jgi:hypothetical protein